MTASHCSSSDVDELRKHHRCPAPLPNDWPISHWEHASKIFPPPWSSKPAGACSTRSAARSAPWRARALDRPQGRRTHQGSPSVNLIGGGSSAPDWAAFANGVHIRYFDCNDTYLSLEPAHPSDNWAAVMAAGQLAGADGKAWIAAAAVAYEAQCRLCDAASIRARGWDHTTYGSISATLAAAMLLKLTHEQTVHALGIASTTGTAPAAHPRRRALDVERLRLRVRLAQRHFRRVARRRRHDRPRPALRRRDGFLPAGLGPLLAHQARRARPTATGCSPKPRSSSCPPNITVSQPSPRHSTSAARSATRKRIRDLEIATFRTAVEIIGKDPEKWRPQTRETADHSLPYCTAVALVDGKVSSDQFTAERMRDPALLDLVARTRVIEDPKLTAGYPEGIPNRVTVTLDDGRKLVAEVTFPPGHDRNPLSDDQLAVKFHELADPVLGPAAPTRSVDARLQARARPNPARNPRISRQSRSGFSLTIRSPSERRPARHVESHKSTPEDSKPGRKQDDQCGGNGSEPK